MRAELGCAHARWAQVPSCEVGLAAYTRAELMSPHLIETEETLYLLFEGGAGRGDQAGPH